MRTETRILRCAIDRLNSAPSARSARNPLRYAWPVHIVLERWADLGRQLRLSEPLRIPSFSQVFERLIAQSKALQDIEFKAIDEVSKQTHERLRPLGEPMRTDLEINRWLRSAREESYSDWLGWLFSYMTIDELAGVISIPELLSLSVHSSSKPISAIREFWVEHGHKDRFGRLDILLHVGDQAIIAVELKRGTAAESDTEKQKGYFKAIESAQRFAGRRKFYIIFVTTAEDPTIDEFEVRLYDRLCRNLRRLAEKWIKDQQEFMAAMALMVGASIETNLLRFSLARNAFTPHTLAHLKQFLERPTYE